MALTVSEVARLSGVTVRTLHHYDEIGLVRPSGRTDAGYRLYDTAAIERLQEVLLYRALEFSLEEIARIVDDPDYDRAAALRDQHELLSARAERTTHLIKAVEAAMNAHDKGINLTDEELLEVFGEDAEQQLAYAEEARDRWGQSEAWEESRRRTNEFSKEDWLRVKAEGEAQIQAFVAAKRAGLPAESADAMDAAEDARLHIDRNFYPCSHEMHAGLGDMYVGDPRFTATYDEIEPGLAHYVRDAIIANGVRHA